MYRWVLNERNNWQICIDLQWSFHFFKETSGPSLCQQNAPDSITASPAPLTVGVKYSNLYRSLIVCHTCSRPLIQNNVKDDSSDYILFFSLFFLMVFAPLISQLCIHLCNEGVYTLPLYYNIPLYVIVNRLLLLTVWSSLTLTSAFPYPHTQAL